ncbi:helix-turn-helix domain-containing protein [Reyranella sp. MMS21-HV4-11]|jgi:transcriptional regulator with XRE-family HTH domain|uniref:Helix-turn-helix domain-containing protein n=1 Tax=Reyranella humidisoli TaxID=2849149 RepID=A0ABS6IJ33_9HYPH|nr:helix-turn-helix transcriptional regulator [Reyranella sp. MMS21-HV4-11]MBU8874601.1 helix-turn-helix domain-containing protein [Reyranella sp. MMS21-HV4-11]
MSKPSDRPYSRYSRDALTLLGQLIRRARIDRKLTAGELATRAGVSRGLIQRIERGDPGCTIGAVFEIAAILGVRLFDADASTIRKAIGTNDTVLGLLPKSVRPSRKEEEDDF